MRTPFQPYGGVSPIIDKMIGNAYDVVKYVARYLKEIRYVAENMETIYEVAHLAGGQKDFIEVIANGSDIFTVSFPEGRSVSEIRELTAVAIASDGRVSGLGGDFMIYVNNGQIQINLWSDYLRDSTIRISISYMSGE